MICETYRNVSCLFKEAEKCVRKEIEYDLAGYYETGKLERYNEYGIDFKNPYEGMFLKTGQRFEFTMNHSKRIYYSLKETTIYQDNHSYHDCIDPLPMLMGYGKIRESGEWLGDVIGVSNQRPDGYSLIEKIYLK